MRAAGLPGCSHMTRVIRAAFSRTSGESSPGCGRCSTTTPPGIDNEWALATLNIAQFLVSEGFDTAIARQRARAVLNAAGLTNPRKQGFDDAKLSRIRAALAAAFTRVCDACWELAPGAPPPILVSDPNSCAVCKGSNNRRAALRLAHVMRREGARNLLVVGGTPAHHNELRRLLEGSGIEVRCIDGAARSPSQKEAWSLLQWADITVIWASTPLPHKVSTLFTSESIGRPPLTVARRGIEALCSEVCVSLERHGAR